MSRRHYSQALCRLCAVSILLFLSTVLFSSATVPASPRAASKKVTAGRMVCGMSEKEVRRMVLRCIREGKDWDYLCQSGAPVWKGGKRWDCSVFVHCFYNNYLLPRASQLNRSRRSRITDENGNPLREWAYYRYQTRNGSRLGNNTKTILSQVGTPWTEKRVKSLVKHYQRYQKGKKWNSSFLPETGDILLYGSIEKSGEKRVRHVGIYLGEYHGRGNGYYMAECTLGIVRQILGMKKKDCIGNWNGAAINPFWVSSSVKQQTLFLVSHFVSPKPVKRR